MPCFHHLATLILQREPNCDLALVHDDDLERVLGVEGLNVSEVRREALLLIYSCP